MENNNTSGDHALPEDIYWQPNTALGFVPISPPPSPSDLCTSSVPFIRTLGSSTPVLGDMSDDAITDFVSALPGSITPLLQNISIPLAESLLRCYVNIAAHLIHRPRFSESRSLPHQVAVPLWSLSSMVRRPPSLTYATYVLSNFASIISPLSPPQLLAISQTPSGTTDESWFVAVHLSVESAGGVVVSAANTIERALCFDDYESIVSAMESIESSLEFAVSMMPTVKERLDPGIFRAKIRPFLFGHSPVQFTGVPNNPTITYIGETGAQSGFIKAADSLLGTLHSAETIASMDHFLACAPHSHRLFFDRASAIGLRLSLIRTHAKLRRTRKSCLQLLAKFRRIHLAIVNDYLLPDGQVLSDRGTGGTFFQTWLQSIIVETDKSAADS